MLAIKKNNTLVPLTSDARIGNPLGTILAIYTTRVPAGYLPCNGVAFDQTQYPALYALLGTNVLPDLREATLKGIGLNSNATDHVSTNGLTVGEYLDDRVQAHAHDILALSSNTLLNYKVIEPNTVGTGSGVMQARGTSTRNYAARDIYSGRNGATTEVKSVGVNYVIKAVPGIEESQADYVAGIIEDNFITSVETFSVDDANFTYTKSGNLNTLTLNCPTTVGTDKSYDISSYVRPPVEVIAGVLINNTTTAPTYTNVSNTIAMAQLSRAGILRVYGASAIGGSGTPYITVHGTFTYISE